MRTGDRYSQPRPRPQEDRPDRPDRAPYGDRPSFGGGSGGGNRPSFPPRPAYAGSPRPPYAGTGPTRQASPPAPAPASEAVSTVCLRDGDRQVTVTGSPIFIRQTLDDLRGLFAKLTGIPAPTPASISLPPASPPTAVIAEQAPAAVALPAYQPPNTDDGDQRPESGNGSAHRRTPGKGATARTEVVKKAATLKPVPTTTGIPRSLEDEVFAVLRQSKRPLKVVEIRAQLDGDVTGQQVRRILERSDRVAANSDKPAGYRLR